MNAAVRRDQRALPAGGIQRSQESSSPGLRPGTGGGNPGSPRGLRKQPAHYGSPRSQKDHPFGGEQQGGRSKPRRVGEDREGPAASKQQPRLANSLDEFARRIVEQGRGNLKAGVRMLDLRRTGRLNRTELEGLLVRRLGYDLR